MKERIRELAEQARKKPTGDSWTYRVYEEFEEEFARLIIQECTKRTWVELSEESALRLWQICKIPVHLDTPDSAALRYARAISFALREANHNTHLMMNERLTEIYRSCRPAEALKSQDTYESANVLMGSEVEKFALLIIEECANLIDKEEPLNTWTKRYSTLIREHFLN